MIPGFCGSGRESIRELTGEQWREGRGGGALSSLLLSLVLLSILLSHSLSAEPVKGAGARREEGEGRSERRS